MTDSQKIAFGVLVKYAMEALANFERVDNFDRNSDGNEDLKSLSSSEFQKTWDTANKEYDFANENLANFISKHDEDSEFEEFLNTFKKSKITEEMCQLYEDVMVDAWETAEYWF